MSSSNFENIAPSDKPDQTPPMSDAFEAQPEPHPSPQINGNPMPQGFIPVYQINGQYFTPTPTGKPNDSGYIPVYQQGGHYLYPIAAGGPGTGAMPPQELKPNLFGKIGFILALVGIILRWFPRIIFMGALSRLLFYTGLLLWIPGAIISIIGLFKKPQNLAVAGTILSFADIMLLIIVGLLYF